QTVEGVGLGEGLHLDGVLDRTGRRFGSKLKTLLGSHDRPNADVKAGRERLVHPHLLTAGREALGERSVIEKAEPHGLLDLVRAVACNEDPGRMSLVDNHAW